MKEEDKPYGLQSGEGGRRRKPGHRKQGHIHSRCAVIETVLREPQGDGGHFWPEDGMDKIAEGFRE